MLLGGAVIMGVRLGAAAVILWFAFAALAGGMLLFWEALRSVIDPEAGGADADQAAIVASEIGDLERRKKAALKALRDLEFEHSIGRLSDEDRKVLREKYRGEAREAMSAIDESLGTFLTEAQALVARAVSEAAKVPEKPAESDADDEGEDEEQGEDEDGESDEDKTDEASSGAGSVAGEGARHSKVEGPPDAGAPATAASKPATSRCPSCETQNDADAVFCKKCASRLQESAS